MKHDSVVHVEAYNVPAQPDAFIEKKTGRFPHERSRTGQAAFSGNRVVISGLSFFRSCFQRFSREIAFCLVPVHDFRTDELRNFRPGGIDGRSEKSDDFIQFPDNGDSRFPVRRSEMLKAVINHPASAATKVYLYRLGNMIFLHG